MPVTELALLHLTFPTTPFSLVTHHTASLPKDQKAQTAYTCHKLHSLRQIGTNGSSMLSPMGVPRQTRRVRGELEVIGRAWR